MYQLPNSVPECLGATYMIGFQRIAFLDRLGSSGFLEDALF
jgi:hypothetical protein